ncbi:hypothetical protein PVAND_005000 [Polypedilum vanderplanki]|uniref:Target of rapamycin complex 2 subunit MAPKAP1 n=1 Tax=Polypedilum vanderplanki TaxID=319348 RepID=A0A9J6BYY9_POLVA|nr:hypothetical protein PVAND_005000 [Polypedilum vanderplanki]
MATFNNKHWLLCHIRNSFISTDDTGISELVMSSDNLAKNLANSYANASTSGSSSMPTNDEISFYVYPDLINNNDEDEEDLLSNSFDINFTQEFAFRFRTNTAAKLEKISEMKKKQSQIKVVKIDDTVIKLNQEAGDDSELFVRKDLSKISLQSDTVKSKLTQQLETLPKIKLNKYREYSVFDGSSYPNNESKTIKVFITPIKDLRDYPLKCCVHSTAKIEEFIGYILFKCTNLNPEYADQLEEVKNYGLFISDETGEPDLDFPALDLKEQVSKYQFNILALSKRIIPPYFQNRTLSVNSDTTTTIINNLPVNRQASIETNRSIASAHIRQNELAMNVHDSMVDAPIYRAFRVLLVTKKHFKTEVQLGISAEKIEIDPLQQKSSNYFFKSKSSHYSMDAIAFCEITKRKSSRFEFRIAYNPLYYDPLSFAPSTSFAESTTSYSSYTLKINTFESDPSTAEEIVLKINNILLLRSGSVRKEYLSRHEKIKKSFIQKKKFPI